jgi:hypothetical protein
MSCNCKRNDNGLNLMDLPDDYSKKPEDFCVLCADKHFSTALTLSKESGYEYLNKRYVVGELVLLQWHLGKKYQLYCKKIRYLRHLWQIGNYSEAEPLWKPLGEELDEIIKLEIEEKGNV